MSNLWIWSLIIGMALVTYFERLSFILILGNRPMPEVIKRALRFVPPAVLAALVTPALFYREDVFDVSFGNARLMAGIAAALVAWLTKNILATIGVGLGTLWVLQWLI